MAYKPSLAPYLYETADSPVDHRYRMQMREQDLGPEPTDRAKPRFTLVVGHSPFSMPRGWEFFLTSPYEGATYVATVLHNAGYPVRIVDVRYAVDPVGEALRGVRQGTDVLGVATFEDNFPFVAELADRVKRENPDLPVVLGGSLVTSVPHVFFAHTRCDVAVISEGEVTVLELMEAFTRGDLAASLPRIRGLWYREPGGAVKATPPRGQLADLDCLPRMRLDLWPQAQGPKGLQPQIISSYSRGCKMDCSFCYRTTPQERSKSPEKLDEELSWLKSRYGIEFVFWTDLTFTSRKDRTLAMLDVIKRHDVRWTCLTRCTDVDKERLDAMREAGADIVLYGVESLGADVLKEARKGNTENITIRAMRATWDAGIRFGGLLIVGLPGETEETLDHACTWAEENNHITRVKYLSLMPGTTVYAQAIERGLIRSERDHLDWLSIEQALHEDEFVNVNGLPEEVIRRSYKRIYDAYSPGPVMDFRHWPEHFAYFHPNPDDGLQRSTDYAGKGWRAEFSSAGPHLMPGAERFTLDRVGAPGMAEIGARQVPSGAAAMGAALAK